MKTIAIILTATSFLTVLVYVIGNLVRPKGHAVDLSMILSTVGVLNKGNSMDDATIHVVKFDQVGVKRS